MDKKYEEIVTKFGRELAALCKKANISSEYLFELGNHIEAIIDDIIENYPEIDDTFVNLPDDDCKVPIDVVFVDGTEMTAFLGIETHYAVTGDVKVY